MYTHFILLTCNFAFFCFKLLPARCISLRGCSHLPCLVAFTDSSSAEFQTRQQSSLEFSPLRRLALALALCIIFRSVPQEPHLSASGPLHLLSRLLGLLSTTPTSSVATRLTSLPARWHLLWLLFLIYFGPFGSWLRHVGSSLRHAGSFLGVHGPPLVVAGRLLSSRASVVDVRGLRCCSSTEDLSSFSSLVRPESEPAPPALTTGPPGQSFCLSSPFGRPALPPRSLACHDLFPCLLSPRRLVNSDMYILASLFNCLLSLVKM